MIAKFYFLPIILVISIATAISAEKPEVEDDFGDIPVLETTDGYTYFEIEVLRVDPKGLTFRHSRGLAKIVFDDLSQALRERFGYDPVAASEFTKPKPKSQSKPPKKRARPVNTIVIVRRPQLQFGPCGSSHLALNRGQQMLPYPLSLSQYPNRRLAELDFLYTTGLLPRPPGIVVRRIWSSF
jgi:hypothetical protein